MRITNEADYAVRIIYVLAKSEGHLPAREIAEESSVTLRFALKILRKLSADGIVASFKGAGGGYKLSADPKELSLGQIIECIDGPLRITSCLSDGVDCNRVGDKMECQFREIFSNISDKLRNELYEIKMSRFI